MKNGANKIDWSVYNESNANNPPSRRLTRLAMSGISVGGKPGFARVNSSLADNLKSTLTERLSLEYSGLTRKLVQRAVTEAHALASLTTVPQLVLPLLAEEKVRAAAHWQEQQREIYRHSPVAFAA